MPEDTQTVDAQREAQPRGRIEETLLRATPTPATVNDAVGVERIVEPTPAAWEPAPVQPDPEDVARAEELQKRFEKQKEERLSLYTAGDVGESAGVAKKALQAEQGGGRGEERQGGGGEVKPTTDEGAKTGGRAPEGRTTPKKAE